AKRRGVGRRTARDRTSSRGKRFAQWQSDACLFRDHRCVGGREGNCFAILGGQRSIARWIHCCDLRRTEAAALLGPAPRRSALRKNRHLARAKGKVATLMDTNFIATCLWLLIRYQFRVRTHCAAIPLSKNSARKSSREVHFTKQREFGDRRIPLGVREFCFHA